MATKAQYDAITAAIIRSLEEGTIPWEKPWKSPRRDGFNPNVAHNAVSGKAYRGLNVITLWAVAEEQGYRSNTWLTFNQAKKLGGSVRKGEKSTLVFFWDFQEREVEDEKTGEVKKKKVAFVKMFSVFNIAQTEGVKLSKKIAAQQPDELPEDDGFDVIAAAEAVADNYLASANAPELAHHDQGRAYYSPVGDYIRLPRRTAFVSPEQYHSVKFHEIAHSTGHHSRLGRFAEDAAKLAPFGSEDYSFEELIAELSAAFLSSATGIDNTREHSAAYLASWLHVLKNDTSFISKAATQAQKVADLVLAASTEAAVEGSK